jgi:hypothetical protein
MANKNILFSLVAALSFSSIVVAENVENNDVVNVVDAAVLVEEVSQLAATLQAVEKKAVELVDADQEEADEAVLVVAEETQEDN